MADLPVLVLHVQVPASPWVNPIQGAALPGPATALTLLGHTRNGHANGQ